jgi:putative ATPase
MVDQEHLPESLKGRIYYQPTDRGFERDLGARLAERRQQTERKTDDPGKTG